MNGLCTLEMQLKKIGGTADGYRTWNGRIINSWETNENNLVPQQEEMWHWDLVTFLVYKLDPS